MIKKTHTRVISMAKRRTCKAYTALVNLDEHKRLIYAILGKVFDTDNTKMLMSLEHLRAMLKYIIEQLQVACTVLHLK